MPAPEFCRAAVMVQPQQHLEIRHFPVPDTPPRGALVRVRCCTICRSDLHTWSGRRPGPVPAILGHEIVGTVVRLGTGLTHDAARQPLHVGDRVTWTLHSSCGACFYCKELQLPMKCVKLRKYGHEPCDVPPQLQGGLAEYCVLDAGTSVLKLPDNLPDLVAAPANCAVATSVAGWEAASLQAGEQVLIQGAGVLGCYAAAFASFSGARRIIVTDVDAGRLEFVRRFGATDCINVAHVEPAEVARQVHWLTDGRGADCALEVAGIPSVVPAGLAALRKGGRYAEIGCCFPDAHVTLDLSLVLYNLLTIRGVHNYDVRHLLRAIDFLSQTVRRFPYHELIAHRFPLDQANDAFGMAEHAVGRVAVLCDPENQESSR